MATTTPNAVLASLATMISGLDPAGGEVSVGARRSSFSEVNYDKWDGDPEVLPDSGLDRKFVLSHSNGDVDVQGGSTQSIHIDTIDLEIGHQIGKWSTGRDRRDRVLAQIKAQTIKESNRPSGVWLIRFSGFSTNTIKDETHWWSTLTFDVTMAVASNYGG